MVKENYRDWKYLLKNFPCETLRKIDQLWLDNSNNTLGISIQSRIYQNLSGHDVWEQFCDRAWGSIYKIYYEIMRDIGESKETVTIASLPLLILSSAPRTVTPKKPDRYST